MKPTPIDDLRKPHPEQKRIDAESAALLRATALDIFRRRKKVIEAQSKSIPA